MSDILASVTSPGGMQGSNLLSQGSRKRAYDSELRMKSRLQSVYTTFEGQYNTEKKTIPNAIYMKVGDGKLSDSYMATITMKYPLRGPGVFGSDIAVGKEESFETKRCDIYRNNCRKVVVTNKYGTEKLDQDYLGLFKQHIDDLAAWNKEQEDLEIHQALLERFGETLWYGETAAACAKFLNPNIFVAGLDAWSPTQPTYAGNEATFDTAVRTAVNSVNSGRGAYLSADALSNISNYALRKRIERLDIPGVAGGKGYVLTISELQAMYLGDPAWGARTLGSLYIARASLPEKVMNWPGVIGAYKDLLFVVDVRQPTLKRATATAALVGGYVRPGDVDERARETRATAGTATLDTAFILGKGALVKWEPEPLHSIEHVDDYKKVQGTGTACVRGISMPIYYDNTATKGAPAAGTTASLRSTTAYEQFGSAVVVCGFPASDTPNT